MKSAILDKNGNNYSITKSQEIPNLDPNFWILTDSTKRSISDLMNQPFTFNPWVYACVRSIAQNIAQLEKILINTDNEKVNKDHRIMKLLKRPNKLMDFYSFFFNIICQLLLPSKGSKDVTSGGQCFLVPWNTKEDTTVNLKKGELPTELMPFSSKFFSPWYVDKNKKGRNDIKGWTFEIPNLPESKINFLINEIVVITVPNPYDYLSGNTPFSTIADTVKTDANAEELTNKNFENDGQLDGILSAKEFVPTPELEKLKKYWLDHYTGNSKDRIAFLSGAFTYQQFAQSAKELGCIELSKWNRQKVLAAYGVNRIALGDYEDINLATIREGRKMLWYDRYIPLDRLVLSSFNGQWIQYLDKGVYKLKSEYSNVPALETDMRERVRIGGILCRDWNFPPELSARILDIPLNEDDLEKWPHLSEPVKSSFDILNNDNKTKMKSFDNKEDVIYSKNYIKMVLDPVERKFKAELDKYFISQRNKIMDLVDAIVKEKSYKTPSYGGYQFIPPQDEEDYRLLVLYKVFVKLQTAMEKRQVEQELGYDITWDTPLTRIDYYTSLRAAFVQSINTSTFRIARNAINETVKQGIADGIIVTELRKNIKNAVHDVYQVRLGHEVKPHGKFDLGGMSSSKTIARTEMGSIASMERWDIFNKEGIKKIRWITAHDEKVRGTHVDCEQQGPIEIGDTFVNTLKYPRQQGGPAKEVINCRCSFTAVIEDED